MATALIGGLVAKGRSPADVIVVEPNEGQREQLRVRFGGIDVTSQPSDRDWRNVDVVVLAVKPQQMQEACTSLAQVVRNVEVVVSIAAGTRIADISRWLGGCDRIVRAMPNTPALVGAGIAGLFASPAVGPQGREAAATLLAAAGEIVWCDDEAMLDAVTGVSGSGPAYVFYFLEALERAAVELGFSAGDARKLAYATFHGAVALAQQSDEDAKSLRARVTSKGGTTERGIATLESAQVGEAIMRAAKAATARARELGESPAPKADSQ